MAQQTRHLSLALLLLTSACIGSAQAGSFRLWSELSPQEQTALSPIAAEWNHLPAQQQEKLTRIAKGFAKLSPAQQQTLQRRLPGWTRMSSEQRKVARQNYQKLMELPQAKQERIKRDWLEARSPAPLEDSAVAPASGPEGQVARPAEQ
ncbi:MAG TPA: DUF3106 domain-containing protein [Thiobacillaceae bacterium]|nr:DUF3106 domain-containing protein [Thiobacillaceae bacterium]HNI07320.1 DUF3106 domain-containing protein [Thiobacillaceae bacterium]